MPTACERTSTSSGPIAGCSTSVTTACRGASKTSAFISVELHPAGDVDPLARHVPSAVGGEEGDDLADVLRLLRAPERDAVHELLPGVVARDALVVRQLVEQRLPEGRPHDARAD